ncbi:uncharacterized protein [Triticum aestivum]|uniref:uncharacterized protein n=1 Tax=Triticum aestivum TaxID=4565 RepID=UPI001D017893|nr:uncharacterized protein LOC123082285 [Triticum aestivum]
MDTHSQSPPLPTATDDGLSAEELAAAAATADARPRASLTPDSSLSSGGLPLAPIPPNPPPPPMPLSVPGVAAPTGGLPASITHIVDFKLALDGSNFARWRNYINLILARHHAEAHVQAGAAARLSDSLWRDDDNTIVLWFYSTVAADLLDIVAPADSTAFTIWKRLHEYFLVNKAELAMYLGQEFRSAVRGDRSINEYCRHLQGIAAALADVREPVTDRTLTLQMLDGLGKKFELQAAILQSTMPLPTFAQARSRLVLAELALDKRARTEGAQVLAVHDERGGGGRSDRVDRGGGGGGSGDAPPAAGRRGPQLGGGGGGRGRGRGRGRGDALGGGRGSQQPWLGYFAPMGLPFPPPRAPWVPPNSASVLGPRPGVSHHAYPVLLPPAPLPSAPPAHYTASPYSWDAAAMYQAAPSHGAAFPPHAEWIMDTGASSHVTGDPGSSNQGGASEVQ